MTYLPMYSDVEYLRNQLADRMEEHEPDEWSAGLLRILIAAFDVELRVDVMTTSVGGDGNAQSATVLQLIRQHDDGGSKR